MLLVIFISTALRTSTLSATELIGLFLGFRFLIKILDLLLTIFPFHLLGLNGLTGDIASLFEFRNKIYRVEKAKVLKKK